MLIALVDSGSDIDSIIKENNIGISIENGNSKLLCDSILYCFNNKEKLCIWGNNAREFAIKNYSRKTQTKKYYNILTTLAYKNN